MFKISMQLHSRSLGGRGTRQHPACLQPRLCRCPQVSRPTTDQTALRHTSAASASSDAAVSSGDSPSPGFSLPRLKLLPDRAAWQLVTDSWSVVCSNIWAVVMVFAIKDAAAFLLHRVAHRLTNHLAEVLFGLPISTLGNPWWIMMDAKFVEGHVSYQVLVGIFFLLCLPLNILLNTAAISTTAVVCTTAKPTAKPHAVPSATYMGQGRGKVGLAECRSTSSLDDGQCEAEWGDFDSSSSSAPRSSTAAAGEVHFAKCGFGCVSFRPGAVSATSDTSSSSSSTSSMSVQQVSSSNGTVVKVPNNKQHIQQEQKAVQQLPQRAAAPVLPWLAPAQQKPRLPTPPGLKPSIAMVKEAWSKQVAGRLRQLWTVDLLFNVWTLPLQALCLAVVPVFWAFPKLLEIQLALPAAVLAGAKGKDALEKSKELMQDFRTNYAWPFVWLIVLGRMLEVVKEFVLMSMPVRWWSDVIEVPLAVTALFAVVRLLLMRVQDLVPLVAYLHLQRKKRSAAIAV